MYKFKSRKISYWCVIYDSDTYFKLKLKKIDKKRNPSVLPAYIEYVVDGWIVERDRTNTIIRLVIRSLLVHDDVQHRNDIADKDLAVTIHVGRLCVEVI